MTSQNSTRRFAEWGQTLVVLLAIVTACVSGALWIERTSGDLHRAILAVKTTHELDQAAIANRLTLGGWSRIQAQNFTDRLREVADHPIPSLE